jgi:hypothetical protein
MPRVDLRKMQQPRATRETLEQQALLQYLRVM